jgi:hypothetical protein
MMAMKQPFLIEFPPKGTPETGFLSVTELGKQLPFEIKRMYWIYNVPDFGERGNHMHLSNEQIIIPMHGVVRVWLENTKRRKFEFELHNPHQGLFVPALYWRRLQLYDQAVVLALSSQEYNEADYVKDYAVFRTLKENTNE